MVNLDLPKNVDFQQVLTNPILDIGARLWEAERYEAFKICYISMRVMDDLVDDLKVGGQALSESEKKVTENKIKDWIWALENRNAIDLMQQNLLETIDQYKIPLWPWQKWATAMIYDLHHDGFKDFRTFIRYSEGAAISPGSIFMHLCGVITENGVYRAPDFDIRNAARPLALFCYLVHVIRDFQVDQNNDMNYLADDMLNENGLTRLILREIAAGGEIPEGFRALVSDYQKAIEYYRMKARSMIDDISIVLNPRYRVSLEIIFNLYSQIYERIDVDNSKFTTAEFNPSSAEVLDRINLTIASFPQR